MIPVPATCEDCHRLMGEGGACAVTSIVMAGRSYLRIPWPADESRNCRDCGVRPGAPHHGNCCLEDCPRCGAQLIGCECLGPAPAVA